MIYRTSLPRKFFFFFFFFFKKKKKKKGGHPGDKVFMIREGGCKLLGGVPLIRRSGSSHVVVNASKRKSMQYGLHHLASTGPYFLACEKSLGKSFFLGLELRNK